MSAKVIQLRDYQGKRAYAELEKHAGQNLAQTIGRRVILFVVTAVVGMALAWSWMTGRSSN